MNLKIIKRAFSPLLLLFIPLIGNLFSNQVNLYSPRNSKTMKRIIFDFWGNEDLSI